MSPIYGTNTYLLGTTSEWAGNQQLIIRTRAINKRSKILVDVTEATTGTLAPPSVAQSAARKAARHFGAASTDYGSLTPWRADRKANNIDGSQSLIRVRHTTFVFSAV